MGFYEFIFAGFIGAAVALYFWMMKDGPTPTASQINSYESYLASNTPSYAAANCIICCERMSTVMFIPCRHQGLCKECSREYLQHGDKCPFCRRKIEECKESL
ncbi:hypothetical protein NPIL_561671 [Nephila pilipes]|uniref:RING-type domain-containing protein n=1 Tax=Nephila pilipes TaxID=299642 RepID=A0A8X6MN84_NEPPI|nr:hypothetical protein NPIL_561671 [Nephila pilipes]